MPMSSDEVGLVGTGLWKTSIFIFVVSICIRLGILLLLVRSLLLEVILRNLTLIIR